MSEPFRPTRKRTVYDLRQLHFRDDVLSILWKARFTEPQPALTFITIARRAGEIERQRIGDSAFAFGVADPRAMELCTVAALVALAKQDPSPIERVWVDTRKDLVTFQRLSSPRARWPKHTVFVRVPGGRVKRIHKRRLEGRWRFKLNPVVYGWDMGRGETSVKWSMVDGAPRIHAVAVPNG